MANLTRKKIFANGRRGGADTVDQAARQLCTRFSDWISIEWRTMQADLKQVFLDILEIDSVSETDSFETIKNWDSVRHLSLILALEERFGVSFEAEEISELISVRAIVEALSRRTATTG